HVPASLNKDHLIDNIKKLQENVDTLLEQNNNQLIEQAANFFNLSLQEAGFLLRNLIMPGQTKTLLQVLSDEGLLETLPDGTFKEINQENFPNQFNAYKLLHKISILLQRMKTDVKNLEYF